MSYWWFFVSSFLQTDFRHDWLNSGIIVYKYIIVCIFWSLFSVLISGTLTFDDFVTSAKYFRQNNSCDSCAPVLILNFFLWGSLDKEISRTNNNSSGAKNNPIKTYSLHNIIINEYLIVILHICLNIFIYKWIVSIQSLFYCLWFC